MHKENLGEKLVSYAFFILLFIFVIFNIVQMNNVEKRYIEIRDKLEDLEKRGISRSSTVTTSSVSNAPVKQKTTVKY